MLEIPKISFRKIQNKANTGNEEGKISIPKISFGSNNQGKKLLNKVIILTRFLYKSKKFRIVVTIISIIALFLLIISLLGFRVYRKVMVAQTSLENLIEAGRSQDLNRIEKEIENSKTAVNDLRKSYKPISIFKFVPYFGEFINDGEHVLNAASYGFDAVEIVIDVTKPYADIIGFTSESTQPSLPKQESAQDKLDFVVKTIPEIIPRVDELSTNVQSIKNEIDQIEVNKYPETIADKKVKENLKKGKDLVDLAADMIGKSKPLLEVANDILGTKDERIYLLIFQNDKELRPTGGFITGYSIAKVNKGKFEPVSSNDIYNLDNRYTPSVKAAEPVIKYLDGPYLISKNYRLRDMNWSPDFGESMKLFTEEIKKVGIKDIDGIIAVDTQLLVNILDVIGVIQVPGYAGYSTDIVELCNCPQVVYELENFADIEGPVVWSENEPGKIVYAPPNYDNRKKIIGPMMNSILTNTLGMTAEKIPALVEAVFKSVSEKHLLLYLFNENEQRAVEEFGIAGKIEDYDKDYLHLNDANLGGRKSNLYVTQEVDQEIRISKDGSVEKTLTITYKNPQKHDGWLNSVLPNYLRVYVPKGSELIDFSGVEEKPEPYEEFNKTVFAGFFQLRPQGVVKVTLVYKLPFKVDSEYKLFIQKQPGTDSPLYSIKIGKNEEETFLKTDKEYRFDI